MKECIYVVEDDENIREIIDLALTIFKCFRCFRKYENRSSGSSCF